MAASVSNHCGTKQLYYVVRDAVKRAIESDCVYVDDLGFEVVVLDTDRLYPLREQRSLLTMFRSGMRSLCEGEMGFAAKRLDQLRYEVVSPREAFDLED